MKKQLIHGDIKISLLKIILDKKNIFLDLLKIGKYSLLVINVFTRNVLKFNDRNPRVCLFHILSCTGLMEILSCVRVHYLIFTDCLSENEQYKDNTKMKRLLQCREGEVKAVYHEKELVDVFLTMSHKLEEHMTGMVENLSVWFDHTVTGKFNTCLFNIRDS